MVGGLKGKRDAYHRDHIPVLGERGGGGGKLLHQLPWKKKGTEGKSLKLRRFESCSCEGKKGRGIGLIGGKKGRGITSSIPRKISHESWGKKGRADLSS